MKKGISRIKVKYGYRTLGLLVVLLVFSIILLVEYIITEESNPLLIGVSMVFFVITAILFVGFSQTSVMRIEKRYFHNDSLIGLGGRVVKGSRAGERGTMYARNEEWSFVCDSDTTSNESVVVKEVMEDRVTLRVEKT